MQQKNNYGFTIVELLVVIVVIGILAAVTVVSYTGISRKATVATIQSDLMNASTILKIFQVEYGGYPATLNCGIPDSSTNKCIKPSGTNQYNNYQYDNNNPQTFRLCSVNADSSISYCITQDSSAVAMVPCPTGYISVPGSSTYGTSDFCVMKYEAKNVGGVATSQAAGGPWTTIFQNNAETASAAACSGCHLITEAEWLTIAQNVLNVPSNWSSSVVGSGYIYRGHNDFNPSNALAADTDDLNGYYGTGESSGDQRRTLTLTNGEVIWDFSGNIWEYTANKVTGGQPGNIGGGYSYRQWNAVTTHGTMSPDPFPVTTGIAGAASWTHDNGIGMVYSSADETAERVMFRGGAYDISSAAGVLCLSVATLPIGSFMDSRIGFRVAK